MSLQNRGMAPQMAPRLGFNHGEAPNQNAGMQPPQGADFHQQTQLLQQQLNQQLSVQQKMAMMQAPTSGIQHLLQFANVSKEQMKEHGIPDAVIQSVERCRPLLTRQVLKLSQEQQNKAAQATPGSAGGSRIPSGQQPPTNGPHQSPAMMPAQPAGMAPGQRPPEFQQNPASRPGSIGLQRQNAPGMMMLPEQANVVNKLGVPNVPNGAPLQQFSKEDFEHATEIVNRLKEAARKAEYGMLKFFFMQDADDEQLIVGPPVAMPEPEMAEWRRDFETASKQVADLETHLGFCFLLRDAGWLKKLVQFVGCLVSLHLSYLTGFYFSRRCSSNDSSNS
jgi:hypothetical protein